MSSDHGYFTCASQVGGAEALRMCQSKDPVHMNLTVVADSNQSRVFLVEGLLSEAESEHIIQVAAPHVSRSLTNHDDG